MLTTIEVCYVGKNEEDVRSFSGIAAGKNYSHIVEHIMEKFGEENILSFEVQILDDGNIYQCQDIPATGNDISTQEKILS